jgi:4-diphosphocytidyl-2-C-methyl-D-erythritol kinase
MATFFEGYSRNDCQELVRRLYPDIDAALDWLEEFAPARLTGTGASVFASFATEAEAGAVLQRLPRQWRGVSARGLNISPVKASIH